MIIVPSSNTAALATNASLPIDWENVKTLTDPSEKQKIQYELDRMSSCSGVPLRKKHISPEADLDGMTDLVSRLCSEAKIARIANDNGNQLLVLQFGSTGSCGDFYDVFLKENNQSNHLEKITGRRLNFICGGGAYKISQTDDDFVWGCRS